MAKAAFWAALIGLTACGGSSAPVPLPAPAKPVASTKGTDATPPPVNSSVPSDEPAPPLRADVATSTEEFAVGDKRVVLHFQETLHPITRKPKFRSVESIVVGNDIVFPPQCDAPTPPASGLCSPSHLELRSVLGKGKDLTLVGKHARGQQLNLLFAAVYFGSPECGAYGYWVLQVGPNGARATSAIRVCSTDPSPEGPGVDFVNPVMRWDPPVGMRIHVFNEDWLRFALNSRTFEWTLVAKEKRPFQRDP